MGRDKALLPYGAVTLVEHVAARVAAAAGSVALVGAPERYRALGFRTLRDRAPGLGPLAGLCAALGASGASWNLVVACDMPLVTAEFLSRLLDRAERSGGDCLVPVTPDGRLEPLCAAYHRKSLTRLSQALDRGVLALGAALAGSVTALWRVSDASCFRNLNTPEDLARHEALSKGLPAPHRS
jgi:molybdenum cofactor guanylyltransferase